MDRNTEEQKERAEYLVALLAEGVDRNYKGLRKYEKAPWSPSSRRAWIEISRRWDRTCRREVALLAEGVDRNPNLLIQTDAEQRRPPRGGRG